MSKKIFFDEKFNNLSTRIESYDFIENFIAKNHPDFSEVPNTERLTELFIEQIRNLDIQNLSFLLIHNGFIPEHYPADSSPETLYSKLVEALVLEFGIRIGYNKSYLPTQKSSMEDVTLIDEHTNVIVCDSKSFRLGRSQAAPNVKDVLKHADIQKWMDNHKDKRTLGGLVTMPSQHDWAKGSDFYSYTSDKALPTLCLYYEHLAFMLIMGYTSEKLNSILLNYGDIFPEKLKDKQKNRNQYYTAIESSLFIDHKDNWNEFNHIAQEIIKEKAFHVAKKLSERIDKTKNEITETINSITDIDILRKMAIDSKFNHATEDLRKQSERIHKFRHISSEYKK